MLFQYVDWDNIKNVDHSPVPGSNRWVFNTVDGRELILANISKELGALVMKEYLQRREITGKKEPIISEPVVSQEIKRTDYHTLPWQINDYRSLFLTRALILIILQVILIPISIWFTAEFGVNQGSVLLFVPIMFASVLIIAQSWMPARFAITSEGVYVKKKGDVAEYKFSTFDKASLYIRGIKLWHGEGMTETIDYVTPTTAARIIEAMEAYKREQGIILKEFSQVPEIMWKKNRAYSHYQRLFVAPILAVASFDIIMIILSYLSLIDGIYTFLITSITTVHLIFLIVVWFPLRHAPVQIGFSSEGLHCRYVKRKRSKPLLKWVAWADITEMDLDSGPEDYVGGTIIRGGKGRNYAQVQTRSGMRYLIGPVDDDIFGELRLRGRR
jgi:hypothetical protein